MAVPPQSRPAAAMRRESVGPRRIGTPATRPERTSAVAWPTRTSFREVALERIDLADTRFQFQLAPALRSAVMLPRLPVLLPPVDDEGGEAANSERSRTRPRDREEGGVMHPQENFTPIRERNCLASACHAPRIDSRLEPPRDSVDSRMITTYEKTLNR
jgi:hypothetical protein